MGRIAGKTVIFPRLSLNGSGNCLSCDQNLMVVGRPLHGVAACTPVRRVEGNVLNDVYCDATEPSIEELLADPILHLVLRRDRLELADAWLAIVDARQRLASSARG